VRSDSLGWQGAVLLFVAPECSVCKQLAESLQQAAMNGLPPIVAFCQGGVESCRPLVKALSGEVYVLVEGAEEVAAQYHVSGFPTAVVVDGEQKVRGYGRPENVEALRQLIEQSTSAGSSSMNVGGAPVLRVFGPGGSQ
jgi:thioredoxin-related protein